MIRMNKTFTVNLFVYISIVEIKDSLDLFHLGPQGGAVVHALALEHEDLISRSFGVSLYSP